MANRGLLESFFKFKFPSVILNVIIILDFVKKSFKIHFSSPICKGLSKDVILLNKKNNNETANMKDFEKVNQKLSFLTDKVEQIENMQLLAKNVENMFSKNQINSSKRIAWISILQIAIIFVIGSYNVYAIKDALKNKTPTTSF